MKAIQITHFVQSPSSLTPTPVPSPHSNPSNLHIRITHASVTHVDVLYSRGQHQNNRRHMRPPFILGTEFAGTILSAPSDSSFKPGEQVFGGYPGAFATQISVPSILVQRVPAAWTNAEACAVGASGAIGVGALEAGRLKSGEWVLVTGASGGLGVLAVQVAKAMGAKVVALAASGEKEQVVKRVGADEVVNYDGRWEEKVQEVAGGGVDVVYDAVGLVEKSLKCLNYGGRIVLVGFAGRAGVMEKVPMNRILLKGASVIGYRFGEQARRAPRESQQIWSRFQNMIDSAQIKPVVFTTNYPGLSTVPRAMEDLESRKVWSRLVVDIADKDESDGNAKL